MPLTKKITELLSKKYNSNITILGTYANTSYTSILDNENGTIFLISDADLYSFIDQNRNYWVTPVDSFHANGKDHNPKLGESYITDSGTAYSFTSKEAIVEMAIEYFEKHKHDTA
ncbi:hypothetical protein ACQ9BO_19530 [Flavobacterium sp. P21]|uniref:hypothetical protein n=1 Tax=Flavobacterium sp. P21 TaxID=3423948 RepID=UPI003D67B9D1